MKAIVKIIKFLSYCVVVVAEFVLRMALEIVMQIKKTVQ